MKKLPLISNDYALFDWQANETTKRAYEALTSQGQCGDFAQSIWNDIVDKLHGALTEAELVWNNTYGEIDDIKMKSPLDILTANRFNAITYNIEQIINTSWKWSVDKITKGYLGRPRVYGYEQKGKDADIVYGWYLLELVRVLNVFLSILKNDANFGELVYESSIQTLDGVDLALITSPAFGYHSSILSNNDSALHPLEKLLLEVKGLIESNNSATLLPVESFPVDVKEYSESFENVTLTPKTPELLKGEYIDKSLNSSDLLTRHSGVLDFTNSSKTNYRVDLTGSIPAKLKGEVRSLTKEIVSLNVCIVGALTPTVGHSKTSLNSSLRKGVAGKMDHSYNIETSLDSNILIREVAHADSYLISNSLSNVDAYAVKPRYGASENKSFTNDYVDLMSGRPKLTESKNVDLTNSLVNLAAPKAGVIQSSVTSSTTSSVNLSVVNAKGLASYIKSKTKSFAQLTFKETDWIYPIQTDTDLYIQQIYDGYKENADLYIDTEYWLAPIQDGTDLFIRQVYDENEVKGE